MNSKLQKINNHGQALVEFVLILPILILLLFAVYDFGNIFTRKISLEDDSSDIVSLYNNGNTIEQIRTVYPNLMINISDETDYHKIVLKDSIKLKTPGFNRIFGNPYVISVERYIPNE